MIELKKKNRFWICLGLLLFSGITWAAQPPLGLIQPGVYPLVPINNHRPEVFKNSDQYWKSLQNVELTLGGQEKYRDLPDLKLRKPFTGAISLGDRKFGVIVDIAGDQKRLYIDTDGDGSFAKESWHPLLNEWQGLQIYWVEGPEPIELTVNYNTQPQQQLPLQIYVGGVVNKPGPFYNAKPYLKIQVRTWFLAKIREDGAEKLVAVVDQNNNGRFNDPEDQLFVDFNDDGYFNDGEALTRKKELKLKSGKEQLRFDWDVCPTKLVIGGKQGE